MRKDSIKFLFSIIILGFGLHLFAGEGDKDKSVNLKAGGTTTTFTYGGFVKADFILSDYSDGTLGSGSAGRDFYIPGTVPVGGEGGDAQFDAHVKESRVNFKTKTAFENGEEVSTYVEMDFQLPTGGNERVSNSYNPRMRHAFIKWRSILAGQTWSTFFNVSALPENVDFVGPAESTIFIRQTMLRFAKNGFMFAIENPETTVTPYGGGGRIVTDNGQMPDFVFRKDFKKGKSSFTIAALARQLTYDAIDDSVGSLGLSLSGKFVFDKDDLRVMFNTGSGMGRYLGLNLVNGAVINADNELDTIDSSSAFISYRHFWNAKWRSNFTYGMTTVDNDTDLTGMGVTSDASSIHVNFLYSPVAKLTVGAEFMHATREIESGAEGDMSRFQFMMKYAF